MGIGVELQEGACQLRLQGQCILQNMPRIHSRGMHNHQGMPSSTHICLQTRIHSDSVIDTPHHVHLLPLRR